MTRFFIQLKSVADAKAFVAAADCCPVEVDIRSGRYLVNGKSIMGLFSIDLSAPVAVEVWGDEAAATTLQAAVAPFVVAGWEGV